MKDSSDSSITASIGNATNDAYNYINDLFTNPTTFIILLVVVVLYIIFFVYLGNKGTNDAIAATTTAIGDAVPQTLGNGSGSGSGSSGSSGSSKLIITILVAVFILLLIINGLEYFFGIDIVASIKGMFSHTPEVDINVNLPPDSNKSLVNRPQVFNIPENTHTFEDAKAVCKAYDAELATYSQLEEAYKDGAEWCNYGWSADQMALYPTQLKTWKGLQKIEGHEHDCGRPGINGGYIANPAVRFGVNCYGVKPKMTPEEEELMATMPVYPKTKKDIALENRVDYWKSKLDEILVSPFNHSTWSKV